MTTSELHGQRFGHVRAFVFACLRRRKLVIPRSNGQNPWPRNMRSYFLYNNNIVIIILLFFRIDIIFKMKHCILF